jgi:hypothetical protein
MGQDDQMRGIQTIYQVHVQPGEDGWDNQKRRLRKQLTKFTYSLETNECMGQDERRS